MNKSKNTPSLLDFGFPLSEGTPAFALLVVQNGKTLFKDAKGCAKFGPQQKCDLLAGLDTPFPICSMTKHFTSIAILMLEEEDKLSIEDGILKYVDLPKSFEGITLRHLIFHTSGIPDYFPIDYIALGKAKKKFTAFDVIEKIKTFDPKPFGISQAYSNSGYVLLSQVIEKASGHTYEEFIQKQIFDRFEMKNAFVATSLSKQDNFAVPYSPWPILKEENWPSVTELTGEGGLWMSLNDFEKWIAAFDGQKIFNKPATMNKFLAHGKLDNGEEIPGERGQKDSSYGYGLIISNLEADGRRYPSLGHSGGMPGSASNFTKFLENNLWVVFFNNNASYPKDFDLLEKVGVKLNGTM